MRSARTEVPGVLCEASDVDDLGGFVSVTYPQRSVRSAEVFEVGGCLPAAKPRGDDGELAIEREEPLLSAGRQSPRPPRGLRIGHAFEPLHDQ
jgi:hypothetical protein